MPTRGRPRKFPTPSEGDPGQQPHAINVVITQYDWYRLQEAAALETYLADDGHKRSVSDVVRLALTEFLDSHPKRAIIDQLAQMTLDTCVELQAARAQVLGSDTEQFQ